MGLDIEVEVGGGFPNPFENKIATIQVGCPDGDVYLLTEDFERLNTLLYNTSILKVIHNAGFDAKWIKRQLGINVSPIWDTFLMERILTAGTLLRCDLASTIWRRTEILIEKPEVKFRLGQQLSERQLGYVEDDVKHLVGIYEVQKKGVKKEDLSKICGLEHDLLPVLIDMELHGVQLDVNAWEEVVQGELGLANEAAQTMCKGLNLPAHMDSLFSGFVPPINLDSWQQVLGVMERSGIRLPNARDATLEEYLKKHPNCIPVRAWRSYKEHKKLASWDYPKYINRVTSRVHTSYNQVGADTGRLSSRNPNLQNVPRKSRVRRIFIPSKGYVFVCADYSQQEMRVMAEVSGDKALRQVCRESDPHLANARVIFNDPGLEELVGEKRTVVKNTGFAMNYGAGPETFAQSSGISIGDAKVILHILRSRYPDVFKWGDSQIKLLHRNGYVQTIWGRKRWFPEATELNSKEIGKYSTLARNTPIQSSSADMMKRAMVRIAKALKDCDAHLVLSIHDEVVVEAREEQAQEVARIVENEMESAAGEMVKSIPCPAEAKVAPCWVK